MARTRTNPRRQPTLRLRPPARTGWENNRRVVALTQQIITLQRRTATRIVDAILEIGRHMSTVRSTLERGEWQRWVTSAIPFTVRTVTNYIALAAWADARPAEVDRLAHLGPTKLYLLAPYPCNCDAGSPRRVRLHSPAAPPRPSR